jgi:outer membrane protein
LKPRLLFAFGLGVILLVAGVVSAQQSVSSSLTLSHAVQIALEKNPQRKAALADTHLALADLRQARSRFMPKLSFAETATRGNDPVYVFGSRLRQQRFTAADFALNRLNTPRPYGNFSSRFSGQWNVFDSFATWHRLSGARNMNDAAKHALDRADQEIIFRVVNAYYQVLLTNKQVDVAQQAVKTAQAIGDRSQARVDAGLGVESDLLNSKVRIAERQQELIRASNDVALAKAELNSAMGLPLDSQVEPSETLAEPAQGAPNLADAEKSALENRSDLKQLESEQAAQNQGIAAANASFGPRVNVFASWEADNPTFLSGGGGNNWLGGVELQFDLFQGGAKRAQLERERAMGERVSAMRQSASDRALLEVRRAYYDLDSSHKQLDVARATVAQAQESLRIDQNRYENGLTTITELLSAEDATRRSLTDYWQALYRTHISYAGLELACGTLSPHSPVVTP